jgi:hypothetical protein
MSKNFSIHIEGHYWGRDVNLSFSVFGEPSSDGLAGRSGEVVGCAGHSVCAGGEDGQQLVGQILQLAKGVGVSV